MRETTKLKVVTIMYVLVAAARFLYGFEGSVAHYTIHPDYLIATYISIGITILISLALILPISKRYSILFASINAASGLAGFLVMGWLFLNGETESNAVFAPLVGAIVFSALLYFRPMLTRTPK